MLDAQVIQRHWWFAVLDVTPCTFGPVILEKLNGAVSWAIGSGGGGIGKSAHQSWHDAHDVLGVMYAGPGVMNEGACLELKGW